jgi:nifR3 family TIM-barrel protein
MKYLQQPFKLKDLELPSNIFYAPLAGCTDYPFRKMIAKYRPGLFFCEMVKMEPLVRNDHHTFHILDYEAGMHPIGAQICGSKPELAGKAARIVADLGFDVIDFNCGCPVDKVAKDGSGSGMLKNPELIGEILSNMIAVVNVPVTVKIRVGWDDNTIVAPEIVQIAEKAGAAAICIHGRTREQGYKGPANWDYIKECKKVAKNIKVIGNGDVLDGPSAERIFAHTGCDGVMIARGILGHPWVVEDVRRHLSGQDPLTRTVEDARKALEEHFEYILEYQNDARAILDVRRVGCWYLKKAMNTRIFRDRISRVTSIEDAWDLIRNCSFEEPTIIEETRVETSEECAC